MSFNIPSFPDLPSLPALPTLPNVLPAGIPTGSFGDMVNAAAIHVGMNDAVQQAQAQIQSVTQLQSFGVPMPPNVMNLAHSALESVTSFDPSSMFKNPAADALSGLSDITGAITSSLTGALSAGLPDSAVAGIKDIADSVSSATRFPAQAKAEICSRISSLGTDVPILMAARNLQNQSMVLNAAVTGAMTSDVKTSLLSNAFPSGTNTCSGLNLDNVFKPVTQASSIIGQGLTSVMQGVTGSFGTIVGDITDGAGNVLSGTKALAQQIMSSIGSVVSSLASAAEDAIGGLISGLKSQLTSLASSFTPMIDGFKQIVQDAKDMIKQAVNLVKSFSLINLLTHTDPCVKTAMQSIVQTDKVDPIAVTEIAKPKNEQVDSPVQTGIDRAKINAPIPVIPEQTKPDPVVPSSIPNPYTKEELAAFKPALDAAKDAVDQLKEQSASDDADIAAWRTSVNFEQKRTAANPDSLVSPRDPNFGAGRSSDPAVNAAWKAVFDQHKAKIAAHNVIRSQITAKSDLYSQMSEEYNLRSRYGKTPYTTQKELEGLSRPIQIQYVFLDSGK